VLTSKWKNAKLFCAIKNEVSPSVLGERNYDPASSEERYQRTPIRPKTTKPIMIPVDQPPPPRERKSSHRALKIMPSGGKCVMCKAD